MNSAGTPPYPELLAPAGDMECVRAAIANGANAIYFGLEKFNARLRAKNFTLADLPDLMAFLHSRHVKGYVTMNTLIFTAEMSQAMEYLAHLNAAGVDGVIVQDIGLAHCLSQWSNQDPAMRLELHVSTQMTITCPQELTFLSEFLAIKQAVLARELSISDIARCAANSSVPLEVFVHGALCVAYSGQCLTSESLGQRSANRGECAQACRLPYRLIVDGKEKPMGERRYLLSPQDLCAVDCIADLIAAGVKSFKIEGRLKQPEYVAAVTAAYRKAIDAALAHTPPAQAISAHDRYAMQMVFSRGFFTGWLHGANHPALTHGLFGKKRGILVGTVTDHGTGWLEIAPARHIPLQPGDGFVLDSGKDRNSEQGGKIWQIRGNRLYFHGKACNIDWAAVQNGQKLWKTADPALMAKLQKSWAALTPASRTVPLHIVCSGDLGKPLTLSCPIYRCSVQSIQPLQAAQKHALTPAVLQEQLGRLGSTGYHLASCRSELPPGLMLPLSELNRTRRALIEQVQQHAHNTQSAPLQVYSLPPISHSEPRNSQSPAAQTLVVLCRHLNQIEPAIAAGANAVYVDLEDIRHYPQAVATAQTCNANIPVFLATPRIQKPQETGYLKIIERARPHGVLIRNLGAAQFFLHRDWQKIGDFSLNIANPYSAAILRDRARLHRLTISYDLNADQVSDLLHHAPPSWFELTLHQHMPMFHMEHCVFCTFLSQGNNYKNCGRPCEHHTVELCDRVGQHHPLMADAACRNTLFNAKAQTGAHFLHRFQSLGLSRFRVELLRESPQATRQLVALYRALLDGAITPQHLLSSLHVTSQLGTTQGTLRPA